MNKYKNSFIKIKIKKSKYKLETEIKSKNDFMDLMKANAFIFIEFLQKNGIPEEIMPVIWEQILQETLNKNSINLKNLTSSNTTIN